MISILENGKWKLIRISRAYIVMDEGKDRLV